jgi:hypothetical protein
MSSSKVLLAYGVFLIVCGVLGWGATGFSERGKTAIASGGGSGAIMLALGLGTLLLPKWRAGLATVGWGMAFLFAGVFLWRSGVAWGSTLRGDPKLLVAILLTTMALVSITVGFVVRALGGTDWRRRAVGSFASH